MCPASHAHTLLLDLDQLVVVANLDNIKLDSSSTSCSSNFALPIMSSNYCYISNNHINKNCVGRVAVACTTTSATTTTATVTATATLFGNKSAYKLMNDNIIGYNNNNKTTLYHDGDGVYYKNINNGDCFKKNYTNKMLPPLNHNIDYKNNINNIPTTSCLIIIWIVVSSFRCCK